MLNSIFDNKDENRSEGNSEKGWGEDTNDPGKTGPFFSSAPLMKKLLNQFSSATRHDLQLGRRLFHFSSGVLVATFYNLFLDHKQVVYILGTCACILYLLEHIRIAYPELSKYLGLLNNIFLRAEEQLKESSAMPYAMALLLTILTFPKVVALIAIYTLAISDPLSAIIGINFGKHKITVNKSWEGSLAFFVSCFACAFFVLTTSFDHMVLSSLKASFLIGFIGMGMEMVPIRIDDNLTIPLFTALNSWIFCLIFDIPVG